MKNFITFVCCNMLLLMFVWFCAVQSQAPNLMQQLEQRKQAVKAEPFKGITTDGKVQPGLFKIHSTGVSTQPVRKAAEAFLGGLNEEQRKRTLFAVNDDEWRLWDNTHRPMRQGVGFKEMTEAQRELAFGLFKASLSAQGLKKTQDIMKLNGTLAELKNDYDQYGEWLYWVTIMGTPSDKQPWGWQLDGHHCIINYFVLGDQVVMTPNFMGSEPVRAEAGKFKGTVVLQGEQDKGFKLFAALTKEQQTKAVINSEKKTNNSLTQAYKDNVVLDYAGIPAAQMNAAQKKLLLEVIAEYVGNMDDGHAKVKLAEVRQHLDKTHFAWIGGDAPEGVFYYRIQSPVILIEFDHQSPVALARTPEPVRYHIHTVVRTPNGNDYGKDLLRQHYERFPHGSSN